MYSILLEGFLGVFGAGRYAAIKKFGMDLPVVYVSPKYECAARYPLALATCQGEVIGEYVADDVYPLRVVLQCFAPVSKRRIKIRASKTNHQDAYLPEDVSVYSVIFVACGAAPECQGWVERIGEPLDGDGFADVDDNDDAGDVADTHYYENAFHPRRRCGRWCSRASGAQHAASTSHPCTRPAHSIVCGGRPVGSHRPS